MCDFEHGKVGPEGFEGYGFIFENSRPWGDFKDGPEGFDEWVEAFPPMVGEPVQLSPNVTVLPPGWMDNIPEPTAEDIEWASKHVCIYVPGDFKMTEARWYVLLAATRRKGDTLDDDEVLDLFKAGPSRQPES